jgi:azurin
MDQVTSEDGRNDTNIVILCKLHQINKELRVKPMSILTADFQSYQSCAVKVLSKVNLQYNKMQFSRLACELTQTYKWTTDEPNSFVAWNWKYIKDVYILFLERTYGLSMDFGYVKFVQYNTKVCHASYL